MKSKKTILVADDDLPILEVMKIILSNDGFNVVTASNGGAIEKMINETHPDLTVGKLPKSLKPVNKQKKFR